MAGTRAAAFFRSISCLILFLAGSQVLNARKYRIAQVEINAYLKPDGSMMVEESRVFQYRGKYTYAYREFPKTDDVNFSDFRIKEGNRHFLLSDSREPGTFMITESDNKIDVRWFYEAHDSERKFTLTYLVNNVVTKYEDCAVLNYQFISPGWDNDNFDISLKIFPPVKEISPETEFWIHGILWFEAELSGQGFITVKTNEVKREEFLEIRVLYPPEIFTELNQNHGRVSENIKIKEAEWFRQLLFERGKSLNKIVRRAKRYETAKWLMPLIAILFLGIWHRLFLRKSRTPKIDGMLPGSYQPELKPAELHGLLNYYQMDLRLFVSTLFTLAYHGYITLRLLSGSGKRKKDFRVIRTELDYSELDEFEISILKYLFNKLGNGKEVDLSAIRKGKAKFSSELQKWRKTVRDSLIRKGFIDTGNLRIYNYAIIYSISTLVAAFTSLLFFGIWALVFLVVSTFMLLRSMLMNIYTLKGRQAVKFSRNLKRELKKTAFSRDSDQNLQKNRIRDLILYGAVFGFSSGRMKKILAQFDERLLRDSFGWYYPDQDLIEELADLEPINAFIVIYSGLYSGLGTSGGGFSGMGSGGTASGTGGAG